MNLLVEFFKKEEDDLEALLFTDAGFNYQDDKKRYRIKAVFDMDNPFFSKKMSYTNKACEMFPGSIFEMYCRKRFGVVPTQRLKSRWKW